MIKCKICEKTEREARIIFFRKKIYVCDKHRKQIENHGKIFERTNRDKNEIINCGDYYEICIYKKQKSGEEPQEIARAKIDKEDLEKIKDYKWCFARNKYVVRTDGMTLHGLILGEKEGHEIDHKNHDKSDNRKQNLRFATRSQNQMNKKARGVYYNKHFDYWQALITKNGEQIFLGNFKDKNEALRARKNGEIKYFGEFRYNKYNI